MDKETVIKINKAADKALFHLTYSLVLMEEHANDKEFEAMVKEVSFSVNGIFGLQAILNKMHSDMDSDNNNHDPL